MKRELAAVNDVLPSPFVWCTIAEGDVTLEDASKRPGPSGTKGGHFHVPSFVITKYPITNIQYAIFVDADDGYRNTKWWDYSEVAQRWRARYPETQPVGIPGDESWRTNITWYEAIAFCRWLDARISRTRLESPLRVILPTEQQWRRVLESNQLEFHPLEWCLNQWGTGLTHLSTGRHRSTNGRFGEHPGTHYERLRFRLVLVTSY